jgi:16S rRNA processing protein RimM
MSAPTVSHTAEARRPATDAWIEVGRVSRAHGLRGGLLIALLGDGPDNLLRAERLLLRSRPGRSQGESEFSVRSIEPLGGPRGDRVRAYLDGIDRREAAESWIGASVLIPESVLEPLAPGEYYWRDLLGLRCRTRDGEELGSIEEIWTTGSNDVLVVRRGDQTLLVPALRKVLLRVDLESRELWIDPPPGLLEQAP